MFNRNGIFCASEVMRYGNNVDAVGLLNRHRISHRAFSLFARLAN